MAERIELPQKSGGGTEQQLESMYRYLYQMAVALNHNLAEIGGAALTDDETKVMDRILREAGEGTQPGAARDAETLKSMIIKTAAFIKTAIDEYNLKLIGTVEAEGKLGRYVRKTGLDVAVNPEGIEQRFTFEEVIQGLKEYEINAKNYIKSGLLRTVNGIPVYGVAVGKDIVTFAEDGTETYHDGNKVAEYTADGITFWQSGVMIAKYTGNRISFYYGANEIFYIQAGKICCANDLELASGKKLIINTENFKIDSNGKVTIKGEGEFRGNLKCTGQFVNINVNGLIIDSGNRVFKTGKWEMLPSGLIYKGSLDSVAFGAYGNYFTDVDTPLLSISAQEMLTDTGYFFMTEQDASGTIKGRIVFYTGKRGARDNNGIIAESLQEYQGDTMMLPTKGTLGKNDGRTGVNGRWDVYADTVNYVTLVQASSRDVKHDIADMKAPGERIDKLRPVTFVYNDDKEGRIRQGLILEETREIMPEICTEDGINYLELVPMLLKEVQELRTRVAALEEKAKGE